LSEIRRKVDNLVEPGSEEMKAMGNMESLIRIILEREMENRDILLSNIDISNGKMTKLR
jgi:hypothetical protein